jgi:hypothetical protein
MESVRLFGRLDMSDEVIHLVDRGGDFVTKVRSHLLASRSRWKLSSALAQHETLEATGFQP